MARPVALCVLLTVVFLAAACLDDDDDSVFREPDIEPIRATLKTGIPLAYAASAAVAASGVPAAFPSPLLETVEIEAGTLPAQLGSQGTVDVKGLWSSETSVILSVSFVDEDAGSDLFPVSRVSTFPVTITDTGLRIVYAGTDVDVDAGDDDPANLTAAEIQAEQDRLAVDPPDDPEVALDMDSWVVEVDYSGTPGDLSDDEYTVDGGGQYIDAASGSASVLQLGMVRTVMVSDCALNPVDGLAALQEVAASAGGEPPVLATAILTFDADPDGDADVTVATGNYLLSMGDSVDLRLTEP